MVETLTNFLKKHLSSFLVLLILSIEIFSGCDKPSFPKDRLLEDIKVMCQNEYHLDVKAKVSENVLGTYVVLENIFDREQGLSKEASEKIADLLLAVTRISLSTDAPIQFYTVVASDKTIPGVEAVFVRYVDDVKRYLLGGISRDDFFHRLMIDVRFNPASLAERTVMNFFSNLSTGNTRTLLANYLRRSSESSDFSLAFLRMILEMKLKDNVHFEMIQMKIKALPDEKTLVYCKVKETYVMKPGYTEKDFNFPSGFIYEYLFVVGATNYLTEIREVIPVDFKDDNGEYKKRAFPPEYSQYQNTDEWKSDDFLVEKISLPEFLAGQMAQRIVRKVRELEVDSEAKESSEKKQMLDYRVESIKGHYLSPKSDTDIVNPSFELDFKISSQSNEAIPQRLYDVSVEIIKDVIKKYHFEDFKEVRLSNASSKDVKVVPKSVLIN